MFSEILRPYKHGFTNVQHYLENKKPTLLAFNAELVYAAIFEFSKYNDPFQNRQTYACQILEISKNFLDMVSVRPP